MSTPIATLTPAEIPTSSTTPTDTPADTPATEPVKPVTPAGPPEKYDFVAPEGKSLDEKLIAEATPIFKDLGLTQDQAAKLVEFWNTKTIEAADLSTKIIAAQREAWVAAQRSDPAIGDKLESIKVDVANALNVAVSPALRAEFAKAMDFTGIGDNPAFIKVFHALASKVVEGKFVPGGGPSPNGQSPSGQTRRPSLAEAMYPRNS